MRSAGETCQVGSNVLYSLEKGCGNMFMCVIGRVIGITGTFNIPMGSTANFYCFSPQIILWVKIHHRKPIIFFYSPLIFYVMYGWSNFSIKCCSSVFSRSSSQKNLKRLRHTRKFFSHLISQKEIKRKIRRCHKLEENSVWNNFICQLSFSFHTHFRASKEDICEWCRHIIIRSSHLYEKQDF